MDVDGGIPGYSYSWSNGSTTASLSGLVEGSYSVTVTDTYGCTASDSFAVGGIVSIQEAFSFNDIQLAPNPANSYFDIQFTTMSQQNVEVCVYDLLGKRMMQSNMTYGKGTHQKRVSCEGWIPGVYVAALKDNNGAGSYTKVVITNQQ